MMKTKIMGILNITPDSCYDGGQFSDQKKALDHALKMIDEGADWIDIGGESTRPFATPVPYDEERIRVIPLIKELKKYVPILKDINVIIVNGIRGEKVSTEVLNKKGWRYHPWKLNFHHLDWYHRDINDMEVGCALSHAGVWDSAVENDFEGVKAFLTAYSVFGLGNVQYYE